MTYRLIEAALIAADMFRDGDTPESPAIRELVRAADDFRDRRHSGQDHQDNCLMCAVRALTEGDPAVKWVPETPGQSVSGVVLRMGEDGTEFGSIPFVDLWTGGHGRVRVRAFAIGLRHALDQASAKVGDRLTITYDGERTVRSAQYGHRPYKMFSTNVQRGH